MDHSKPRSAGKSFLLLFFKKAALSSSRVPDGPLID
jgi:hypothetical protein